jgi:hypothetical protein
MQTVYIRFELDTDFVGTLNVIYRQYNFPDGWTTEEIEDYIWNEYHDLQFEHYESYSDYYEYCQERGYTEDDEYGVDNDDYWDEYVVHVDEQGGYHVQDFAFDEDEMGDSIYPLEVFTIEGE